MVKTERHCIKGTPEIVRLCGLSREIYNRCNFLMRKAWFERRRLPDINELVKGVESLDCFKNLHNTKTAKQTVRRTLSDWSDFRKTLAAWGKDPSRFISRPRPPGYKEKLAQVVFYEETIKRKPRKQGLIVPTNKCFSIASTRDFKQVVVTPKRWGFVIEVQYEEEVKDTRYWLDKGKTCCIDIGLNNLAAVTFDQTRPILVNGRIVKSINQWCNKNPSRARLRKRYWRLENYFHHASKMIIDACVKRGVGRIIVGRNKGWKLRLDMGSTNQDFQHVPFALFLQKLQYKAEAACIQVTYTEESWTSKASFYDRDEMPEVLVPETEPVFSGVRKHRGLYVTKDGFALNADVNASMNIGRKAIPESLGIGDRSLAARPWTVNPLKAASVKDVVVGL